MNTLKDYYSGTANPADVEKLREICRPVIKYLQSHYAPYDKIIVEWDSAELVKGNCGTTYDVPD